MTVAAYLETHVAIVGTTGAGKTVTGKGYVEQLLADGRQVIVIDPTGAWWGMRANAAGDGPGLHIAVFGGLHSNAPLEADDGFRLAELLIEQRVSAIIDLSEFDEEEQRAFALAFISRLRTKPIGNLHLVIDEADEIAPELVPDSDAFKLKRALAWIAKRGRIRGFVLTIITQRPADIAKSVLALAQTMVVHRLIAPQDQAPIDRYLKSHAAANVRKEVMGSLAGLGRGERWIYSPVEAVLERGLSPALTTFDSSAAPVAGQEASEPKALADVDFVALAEALAASRPTSDPIAAADAREPGAWDTLVSRVAAIEAAIAPANMHPGDANMHAETLPLEGAAPSQLDDLGSVRTSTQTDVPAGETANARHAIRGAAALQVLASITDHRAPSVTEEQWAFLAGFARKGGTWSTYKAALRGAGLIEERGGRWQNTPAGDLATRQWEALALSPGPDLVRRWAGKQPSSGRLAEVLLKRWPQMMSRNELAAGATLTANAGTFTTYLGRLRSRGMLEENGKQVRLNPALMEWQ
nr:DUF87 domain-containing protein [Sphingomonas sp. PAMC 26605]